MARGLARGAGDAGTPGGSCGGGERGAISQRGGGGSDRATAEAADQPTNGLDQSASG